MRFSEFHPFTLLIYFTSVIALSIVTMNPFVLISLFLGAVLSVSVITKKTGIKVYLPLFLIIALTNPIFSHNGETVLFYLFDQRVTLEALFYGFATSLLITGVVFWFRLFSFVFTEDKLTYLIGKISPKISVILIMALRFIPLVAENGESIINSQKALGVFNTNTLKGKIELVLNSLSALISLSVENAIETADIMHSRGFDTKGHTAYSLITYSRSDALFTAFVIAIDLLIVFLMSAYGRFFYYPSIKYAEGGWILCIVTLVLAFLPILNELKEEIKWKYLISKI